MSDYVVKQWWFVDYERQGDVIQGKCATPVLSNLVKRKIMGKN